jgi:iron(III) transport system substrate-binding protein
VGSAKLFQYWRELGGVPLCPLSVGFLRLRYLSQKPETLVQVVRADLRLESLIGFLIIYFACFAGRPGFGAQTSETKLSALDSLSSSERQTKLVEGARAEGELVIYLNLDTIVATALTDGFKRKYPFVQPRVARFSGASIIARAESEARAGKLAADIILSGELGILVLIDKGVMARYRSPQREIYPEGFKDKEGHWHAYLINVLVPAYNTRLVNKEEAPQRLEDLSSPRWKGKLSMDSQSYYWFGAVLQQVGEETGLRLMQRLSEQNIRYVRGRRLLTQLVAAGEFDLAVETNLNSVLGMAQQGAPVWFAPMRPLYLRPSFLFLTQAAPHPYAGALFIDYLLSEEAQKILIAHDRMPAHPRVAARETQLLKGLEVKMPDVLDIGRRYAALGKKYLEVFPGAR